MKLRRQDYAHMTCPTINNLSALIIVVNKLIIFKNGENIIYE